ncbi:hypothetical protein [Amycolatopsis aidingensis]|uniref:hypothetical protein n=1 Tax=Amycolatopsis aidingensis TaxID=2842453 RepID=UPI001C0E6F9E|nr:hypothetical protein [Amycolatopsis aidingensis]
MSTNTTVDTEAARRGRTFLATHARVLERRLAELHLDGGGPAAACAVLDALAAHRNPDGGLGHALEPDVRAPASQPLAVDFGLEVLEQVLDSAAGADELVRDRSRAFAEDLLPFLASVTTADGGLPIVLPSIATHPRAEHWGDGGFPAGLNPTAGIVARLRRAGVTGDSWLSTAEAFCLQRIEALTAGQPCDAHTALNVLRFLARCPDRDWAERQRAVVTGWFGRMPLLHLHPGAGYGLTPLDFAPGPEDPLRAVFPADAVRAHLDALAAAQAEDGGWPLSWRPPGPAAELEWRGVCTLNALRILAVNPR